MKALRDDDAFRRDQAVLARLSDYERDKRLTLVYFDESGFSMKPVIPYAWQPRNSTLYLPAKPAKRLNVLGFISRTTPSLFHQHVGTVNTEIVINAFDQFAKHYNATCYQATKRPCIVVLDNASMHRSRAFREKVDDWMAYGVCLHYLPPYSPELNRIERLWRQIKYHYLSPSAYTSFETLTAAVANVLEGCSNGRLKTFA